MKRAGFTLIELLVVISIIALLVSILIPSLQSAKEQAETISCLASIRSIKGGMDMYVSDWNVFPAWSYKTHAAHPMRAALNDKAYIFWDDRLTGKVFNGDASFPLGPKYVDLKATVCPAAKRTPGYMEDSGARSYDSNVDRYIHYDAGWPGYFCKPELLKFPGETWLLYEQWQRGSLESNSTVFDSESHRKARNIVQVSGTIKSYRELAGPMESSAKTLWLYNREHGCLKQGQKGHEHPITYVP